jgi:hypothetical protein
MRIEKFEKHPQFMVSPAITTLLKQLISVVSIDGDQGGKKAKKQKKEMSVKDSRFEQSSTSAAAKPSINGGSQSNGVVERKRSSKRKVDDLDLTAAGGDGAGESGEPQKSRKRKGNGA